jgi:DNA-binding protein H-NS
MLKSKLQDLLAQRAALEKQIAHTQRTERVDAIGQVRTLMSQYGLTLADIGSKVAPALKTGKAVAPAPAPAPAVKVPKSSKGKKTGKVAPKYRDAMTGQTWSGRGLQPNWLKAALATGRSIVEFKL